jgi:osmotically-inducible protein OsmY
MTTLTDHLAANQALRVAVVRKMERHPDIDSVAISVEVQGPTVTLTGFVRTFTEKVKAEEAAKSVRGVLSVANDIEVYPSTRTDPEIAREAQHVLSSSVMLAQAKIIATVHQGFVTLEGAAEWNFERYAAAEAVESVRGVRGVINQIERIQAIFPD